MMTLLRVAIMSVLHFAATMACLTIAEEAIAAEFDRRSSSSIVSSAAFLAMKVLGFPLWNLLGIAGLVLNSLLWGSVMAAVWRHWRGHRDRRVGS